MEKQVLQSINAPVTGNLSNKFQHFEGILLKGRNFHINSYQICKTWLKARFGRFLSNDDVQHYQRIVMLLKEMGKLMEEITTMVYCEHLKKIEVFEKVRAIVGEKLGIEPDQVTPLANFANDLGADYLDTVELVMALEEAFDIEIPDNVAARLLTVQQTIDYIYQKLEVAV